MERTWEVERRWGNRIAPPPRWAVLPVLRSRVTVPTHLVLFATLAAAQLIAIHSGLHQAERMQSPLAIGCGLGVLALALYARYVLRFDWLSAPVVYLLIYWMFYFGLACSVELLPELPVDLDVSSLEWFYRATGRLALLLALLGATGFLAGLGCLAGRPVRARPTRLAHESSLYVTGWLLMVVGFAMGLLGILQTGGLAVFARSYPEFRETTLHTTLMLPSIQLAQLGGVLVLCGAGERRWARPLGVWAAFGLALLLLGLRSQAMIPLVTFAVLLGYRGVRFGRSAVIAAVAAALIAMPAIQVFRQVGFLNRSEVDWIHVTPLDTLLELGGTLRAAHAYVDWIDRGDPLLYGGSYWAPFDRHFLVWLLPGRERVPIENDVRVPGRQMYEREGAVGSAAVGEAFYNFGALGPLGYFALVGLVFGWLDRMTVLTPYYAAMLGAVMLIFYWNIRGQWISVPAQLAFSVAVILGCSLLRRSRRGAERRG